MEKRMILIVEDDSEIRYSLEEALSGADYEVRTAASAGEARQLLAGEGAGKPGRSGAPEGLGEPERLTGNRDWNLRTDLVLLDLGLPDSTGFFFCEEIKRAGGPPVIILSARNDEEDIIRGLDLGAEDYVTKPFRLGELRSRIGAVLRRTASDRGDMLTCGDVRLDREGTSVTVAGKAAALTAGEYRLLRFLLEHKGKTLTRSMLLEQLWDMGGEFVGDKALTVSIKRLREKLGGDPQRIVKTVRGIGYRAEDGDER